MATPSEKLAQSLEKLHELQNSGTIAIRFSDISRIHRMRLVKAGFLQEVIRGWYIPSRPDEPSGESTAWYASFWDFSASYLNSRFGKAWCLSPEQSLLLHSENWTVPQQLLVRSPKGENKVTQLPFNTSLLNVRLAMPKKADIEEKQKLRIFSLVLALITCSPQFFIQYPTEARAVLSMIGDASEILPKLLDGGHSTIAGRLAGAFRNMGKNKVADDILKTMQAAGYDIREVDPFDAPTPILLSQRSQSPYVSRVRISWHAMRSDVLSHFPKPPPGKIKVKEYLNNVDEIYVTDAYHSLSIEGYRVSRELIERVRSGNWNPENSQDDNNHKNALAARGYWQAFQAVKKSIQKVIKGENAGEVAWHEHGDWYREMWGPCVTAGILKPADLAGYRSMPVFIRRSMHVPPNVEAVRDLMPAFFDLLKEETEPAVRVVLGHFFFVYIHPYMDGNGRIGRFLMNVMFASGGYPWTVVPVEKRDAYMAALEEASVRQNIVPFCKFLAGCMAKPKL
jgi:hypothetical protein